MILTDNDIHVFRSLEAFSITPWDPEAVQPASYDLHLAPHLKRQIPVYQENARGQVCVDTYTWVEEKFSEDCRGSLTYDLTPGEFLLFSTIEWVELGARIAGQVAGKSSMARQGLVTENAGWVDPGFHGTLTLEFSNIGGWPITLTAGMPICQIVLMECRSAAQRPYGTEGVGRYQNQTGPTNAR